MSTPDEMSDAALPILERLRAVLGRLRPGPQEIFDESTLADPKPAVEAALAAALRGDVAHPFPPAEIQGWLLSLAQFQPGVGAPILEPASEVARRMTDAKAAGERVDTAAIQRDVDAAAREGNWQTRRRQLGMDVGRDRNRLLGLLARR